MKNLKSAVQHLDMTFNCFLQVQMLMPLPERRDLLQDRGTRTKEHTCTHDKETCKSTLRESWTAP